MSAPPGAEVTGSETAAPASGTGPDRGSRVAAWIAVLTLVAGLAVAPPWGSPDDIPEGFAARFAAGDLERADDGGWTTVRPGELVADGTTVRSADGAELTVSGGVIALAGGSEAVLDDPVTLERGRLLTEVDEVDRSVRLGSVVAVGRGAWRADAGPTERLGVYRGGVGVRPTTGGDGVSVAAFEQAELLAGSLPETSLPLRYAPDDPWDARLLAAAIGTDREVERLERSLAAEYGSAAQPAGFYTDFEAVTVADVARLEGFGLSDGDAYGPPSTVIVHLTVLRLLADATPRTAAEVAERTAQLRREGATWGLVLARSGLGADDLRAAVDLALVDAPPPPPPPPPPDTGPATADEPDADDGDGGPQPPSQPPAEDPPDEDPPEDDPSGPVEDVVDEVEEVAEDVEEIVDDIIDDLGDGVDGLLDP